MYPFNGTNIEVKIRDCPGAFGTDGGSAILLVDWASSKVNLLKGDTLPSLCDSVTIIISPDYIIVILRTQVRARCALNMEILDLVNEESVSGRGSGGDSL